jgi:hypothetical protein
MVLKAHNKKNGITRLSVIPFLVVQSSGKGLFFAVLIPHLFFKQVAQGSF